MKQYFENYYEFDDIVCTRFATICNFNNKTALSTFLTIDRITKIS